MIKLAIALTKPLRYWLDKNSYFSKCGDSNFAALENKYKGKPLLVIGNGPSLNKTPLDEFKHVHSIGMNKIDLIYDRTSWRPDFVVCVNNLVVRQHQDIFANSEVPIYLSWKARKQIKKENREQVNYFLTLYSSDFSKNINKGLGSSATVTYSALQFAYFVGANPVILFGVDHSFKFEGKKNDYAKAKGEDVNHFDPNYFKQGSWWGLPDLDASEREYMLARKAFESDGRVVYDATINGNLDVFPKISLEEAKHICIVKE